MAYEKIFEKPYPSGWENIPSHNTPVTAQIMDDYDDAIENIEDFLDGSTAVFPITATGGMTQPVGIDENGRLVTMPSSGGGTAAEISYDNTESGLEATDAQGAIDELASDFQDGCDIIVQAVTAKGQTPASNSPQDIATAISNISEGDIIWGKNNPDPSVGENDQYYYKYIDDGQYLYNSVGSDSSANNLILGAEFIANFDLSISKLRGKTKTNRTGSIRIGDMNSILATVENVSFTADDWVEVTLESPVQILAGNHFIIQLVISGVTPSTVAYTRITPTINSKYASFVTTRYGGYPGSTETGTYMNVDAVFNEGIMVTTNQYIKKNGAWVEV